MAQDWNVYFYIKKKSWAKVKTQFRQFKVYIPRNSFIVNSLLFSYWYKILECYQKYVYEKEIMICDSIWWYKQLFYKQPETFYITSSISDLDWNIVMILKLI